MSQSNKDIQKKVLVNSWRIFEKWESKSNEQKLKNFKHEKTQQVIGVILLMSFTVIIFIFLLSLTDNIDKEDINLKIYFIVSFVCIWIKGGVRLFGLYEYNKYKNNGKNKKNNSFDVNDMYCVDDTKENMEERTNHSQNSIQQEKIYPRIKEYNPRFYYNSIWKNEVDWSDYEEVKADLLEK